MKQEWTAEPWVAGIDEHYTTRGAADTDDIYSSGGRLICRMTGDVARSYHDERRIVACVNALRGSRPAALAGLVKAAEAVVQTSAEAEEFNELSNELHHALAAFKVQA